MVNRMRAWVGLSALVALLTVGPGFAQAAPDTATDTAGTSERDEFNRVVKHLDMNGNFLMVVNAKEAVKVMDDMVNGASTHMMPLMSKGRPENTVKMMDAADKLVKSLYQNSGLREIEGFGASSTKIADDLYRTKAYISRKAGGNGRIWKIMGGEPGPIDYINFMPPTTAFATFGTIDLNEGWSWQFELIQATGNPQIVGMHQMLLMQLQQFQIDLASLISSTDKVHGVVLTLDEKSMVSYTSQQGKKVTFPEPGLALFVKVKDDVLRNFIFSKLVMQGEGDQKVSLPYKESAVNGINVRTYNLPVPLKLPVELSPSFATVDGFMVIASNKKTMQSIIDAKKQGKGMATAPRFKTLMEGMPTQGNAFNYATPVLAKTVQSIQNQVAANQSQGDAQKAIAEFGKLFQQDDAFALNITVLTADGIEMFGKTNMGIPEAFATQFGSMLATVAGIAMPRMNRRTTQASRQGDANNLKQIGLAMLMYSGDHNGDFPTDLGQLVEGNYLQAGKVFATPGTEAPDLPATAADIRAGKCGYDYFGKGLRDTITDASKTILAASKPGKLNGWMNILFADGHVESLRATSAEDAARQRGWTLKK